MIRPRAAERKVAGRSGNPDPCAAFIDRVGFALKRETLEDLGFDLEAALESGVVLRVRGLGESARYIPASWLPKPPERGGGIEWLRQWAPCGGRAFEVQMTPRGLIERDDEAPSSAS